MRGILKSKRIRQLIIVYLVFGLLLSFLGIISPGSIRPVNFLVLLRQALILSIVSIGQTFLLISGNIDLSVGATVTLSNVFAAAIMSGRDENILPAVLFCLITATLIGLMNGLIVVKLKVPSFLATLGTMNIVIGIAYIYTRGSPRGSVPSLFRLIGTGRIGILPVTVIYGAAIIAVSIFVLRKTKYGTHIYATGNNKEATYESGVNIELVLISAFIICSFLAGVTGLILAAFTGTSNLIVGEPYLFDSIMVPIVGGATFGGGIGSIEGTVGGALIVTIVTCFLNILHIPQSGRSALQGLILIGAVWAYTRKRG